MRSKAFLLLSLAPFLWAVLPARSEVSYTEGIFFAGPSGVTTNQFTIFVSPPAVRIEEADGRTLLLTRDKPGLQVLDAEQSVVSDLAASAIGDLRFSQMRESMHRLEEILERLPPEQATPLWRELTELRRSLRDTMRGILPWSPSTTSVGDLDAWQEDPVAVERGTLRCRRMTRTLDSDRTRELMVVPWSDLGLDPSALEPMRRVEGAWMAALGASQQGGTNEAPVVRDAGFILEERELIAGRLLWEVIRTPPGGVDADPARYAVPAGYTPASNGLPKRKGP